MADTTVESMAPRRHNLATGPVTVAPAAGGVPDPGIRTALMKALLKGGLKVKDLESADTLLAAFRRVGAAGSTDLYGVYTDLVRAAPATVGGWVLGPELIDVRTTTVAAGGEPTFEPSEVDRFKAEVTAFEANRRRAVETLRGEIARYRSETEGALDAYRAERGLLQELNDGSKGPKEREVFSENLSAAESVASRMAMLRVEDLETVALAMGRSPKTVDVFAARVRIHVIEARTGETTAIHEIAAEAPSHEALAVRIADAAMRALGVKR
jgi:hypothetical protein